MMEPVNFSITHNTNNDGITIVDVFGQITTKEAKELVNYFTKLYKDEVENVVINLGGVTYASSAVLAFFISACGGYTGEGIKFNAAFCGMPANVLRSVESLGLAHLLRITDTYDSAVEMLRCK